MFQAAIKPDYANARTGSRNEEALLTLPYGMSGFEN
jgi:hypothetical protein